MSIHLLNSKYPHVPCSTVVGNDACEMNRNEGSNNNYKNTTVIGLQGFGVLSLRFIPHVNQIIQINILSSIYFHLLKK